MTVIHLETWIGTPIEQCFDLARNIDLHVESTAGTKERAVAGVTSGLIGLDQLVCWEAFHFGIRQSVTMKVTEYERPGCFVDEMVCGPFKSIKHIHEFTEGNGKTLMTDVFQYEVPAGILGRLVDHVLIAPHMRSLLRQRAVFLKRVAEQTMDPIAAPRTFGPHQ